MASQVAYRAKIETFACRDKTFMEDFANALVDRDNEAVSMAIVAAAIASDCVEIEERQRVNVTDVGFFSPVHEIRIRGLLGRYYVVGGLFEPVR